MEAVRVQRTKPCFSHYLLRAGVVSEVLCHTLNISDLRWDVLKHSPRSRAPTATGEQLIQRSSGVVLDVQPCDYVHGATSSEAVPRCVAEASLVRDGLDEVDVCRLYVREQLTSSPFLKSDLSPQHTRAADVTLQWLPDFADALTSDL